MDCTAPTPCLHVSRHAHTLMWILLPMVAVLGGCGRQKTSDAVTPPPEQPLTEAVTGPYGSSNQSEAIARARSVATSALGDAITLRHPNARFTAIVLAGAPAPQQARTSSLTPGWVVDFEMSRMASPETADLPPVICQTPQLPVSAGTNPMPPTALGSRQMGLDASSTDGTRGPARPLVTAPGALNVQVSQECAMPIPGQHMPSLGQPGAQAPATLTVFVAVDGHGMVMGRSQ